MHYFQVMLKDSHATTMQLQRCKGVLQRTLELSKQQSAIVTSYYRHSQTGV